MKDQDTQGTANRSSETEPSSLERRLWIALHYGQHWRVRQILGEHKDLAQSHFGLMVATYDRKAVLERLRSDPRAAVRPCQGRTPMVYLAFSRYIHARDDKEDMLAIADALLEAGADANDSVAYEENGVHKLSVLYGAIGHANNLALGQWLLDNGANPNDHESLYHSTELGHAEGTRLLLQHGAIPQGTNALARALDFNAHETVTLLLASGADPNEGACDHPSGENVPAIPGLHQAARRMCDGRMARLLLEARADPSLRHHGHTPFAIARIYGNDEVADAIAAAGGMTSLTEPEHLLARIADRDVPSSASRRLETTSQETRELVRNLLSFADKLDHVKRLARAGFSTDSPDSMGVTPVQLAGWEGLPEAMTWLLSRGPNLNHVNDYGGTLIPTIIHGSENCPVKSGRNHIACLAAALATGLCISRQEIDLAGNKQVFEYLNSWATANPSKVTEL